MIHDLELAVDGIHSFLHIMKTIPKLSQFLHIDTYAIVLDLDGQLVIDGDIYLYHGTLGVF